MGRRAEVSRATRETEVRVVLDLDGAGTSAVDTGLPFLDHMLTAFSRHGYLGLEVKARGDLVVDAHHTMEDLGLVLGTAIREATGTRAGLARYGWAYVPMDEALARVVVDLSGRPFLAYRVAAPAAEAGGIPVGLFREFFRAVTVTGGLTLHVEALAGEEVHHVLEAVFKAFGRALDQAVRTDTRDPGVPSTKGALD